MIAGTETAVRTGVVEKFVAGGYGLLRDRGEVIFCRDVIPGEQVAVSVVRKKRGILWAEPVTIIKPSRTRIGPACSHFPACGGCDFMHLDYRAELGHKRTITVENIRRIAGRELPVAETISHRSQPLGYRNTIRLQGRGRRLGYFKKESHTIIAIDDCPIAADQVRERFQQLRHPLRRPFPGSVTIRAGGNDRITQITTSRGRRTVAGEQLCFTVAGHAFTVSPTSFFQVNLGVAELLVKELRRALPPGKRLVDLFAGVGLFAVALADQFETVDGYELSRSAVTDFADNTANAPLISVNRWDAGRGLPADIRATDTVILDPPRTGLPPKLIAGLTAVRPHTVAYISCDTATFARDITLLTAGGFQLRDEITLFDMFPRTAHMELLAVLQPAPYSSVSH